MPRLALALCVLWFVSLFVYRSFVQWRRTGSTGMKGFHGRIGSLPWIAGTTTSLGILLTPLAPVGALLGWWGFGLLEVGPIVHGIGVLLTLAGIAGALRAQLAMGDSWRIGVDDSESTALVTEGIYAWVRNPIFSFLFVAGAGFLCLVPSAASLLAAALLILGIELQVRHVEEPHLLRTHGEAYARYVARVGRFVPGIGRLYPA